MKLIELHILQSFPVSCLSRDDTGAPRMAVFRGVSRARSAGYWTLLKHEPIRVKRGIDDVGELVRLFRGEVELMIPEIPPPL
jgi:hypothetical protein